ncbi:choice-of-anchor J domain-containing protein [Aquimarina sp. RZ0]|uniref:T9SS-dependent choice-of-anchor J family protein n=1 Tax=Aquimarina sp. RZ0 TaxID=2607730 RepID=UPI0011F27970|nr:choice-of-anchor J domain-containing protein [Aquimarina sp. RZ0]KAA1242831.1 T9SS type A sorting domain-containing protein [Aquimarina sp. RZ0]
MKKLISLIAISLFTSSLFAQHNPKVLSQNQNTENYYNPGVSDFFSDANKDTLSKPQKININTNSTVIEDFESGTFPPAGWNTFSPTNTGVWQEPFIYGLDSNGTYSIMTPDDGGEGWLVSPKLKVPAGEYFSFFATDNYLDSGQTLKVMISTNEDYLDTSAYTTLLTIDENAIFFPFKEFSIFNIDVSSYVDQEVFFAFVYDAGIENEYWVIDDIHFSSCPLPSNLESFNSTESTIELTWEGNAESYTIEYGESVYGGMPLGSGTRVEVSGNSYKISNLNESTWYDLYIRANCKGEESLWHGFIMSKTDRAACDPITEFPYFEDFENIGHTDEIDCLTIATNRDKNGGLNGKKLISSQNYFTLDTQSGNQYEGLAALGISYNAPGYQWMIAPPVTVPDSGLFFRFAMRYTDGNGTFSKVHINIYDFETDTWNVIKTYKGEEDINLWERIENIDLSPFINKTIRVAIVHEQAGIGITGEAFYVDNIEYTQEDITLSVDDNSSTENVFQIYPNPANDEINIKSNAIIEEISVSNLLGQTTYQVINNSQVFNLNLKNWKTGIYLFKISTNNGLSTVKKIIIK